MKKVMKLIPVMLFLGSLTLVSCKREFNCVCTSFGSQVSDTPIKATKSKAEEACETQGSSSYLSCELQ